MEELEDSHQAHLKDLEHMQSVMVDDDLRVVFEKLMEDVVEAK